MDYVRSTLYMEKVAVTRTNKTCQELSSQNPHKHSYASDTA